MTILNVKTARAIWLVDSRDLNPHGIDIFPILSAIRDRYRFQVYPRTIEEMNEHDPKGIVFVSGSFPAESQRYTVGKATMYGDGLVVDTALSTDFSEAFLEDVLNFLSSQFGLTYRPEMIHRKIYASELIVQTDKNLNQFFAPLAVVREHLNLLTGRRFEPFGFGFATDPAASVTPPAPFKFEREIAKPFDQRRYYSSAPLRTSEHEELLNEMEALL